MKLQNIILSTAYLPPIEYFAYIVKAENIWIETQETFAKQTYRNRCKIYTANGVLALSIPVTKTNGNHTKTKDIEINNSQNWQKDHWRAIESAYNASPYFEYLKDDFENFFSEPYSSLLDFNMALLKTLFGSISLKKEIKLTESYQKKIENTLDLRNHFSPKKGSGFNCPKYYQVFDEKHGFEPNLSIIDLLFMEGPNTLSFLLETSI